MTYPFVEKETQIQETRAKYQEALQPFNRPTPQPFPEETRDEYRRRALPILQNYAPGMQEVKVHDARGTAFDMIEKQTFEAARREAQNPTQFSRWGAERGDALRSSWASFLHFSRQSKRVA